MIVWRNAPPSPANPRTSSHPSPHHTILLTPIHIAIDTPFSFSWRGGRGAGGGSLVSDRLVIYSSNTPDKDDFKKMLTCAGFEYPFDNTGMEMSRIIETAVKLHSPGGNGFTSIALACHGPAAKKGDGSYDKATFEWEISEFIRVNTAEELRTEGHPVRVLMQCLGNAVVKGGRVDLLACNLLLLDEGKAIFAEIEAATQTNFAASCDLTGNPTNPDQNWIMESDNIDIFPFYFCKDAAESFDGKFGLNVRTVAST